MLGPPPLNFFIGNSNGFAEVEVVSAGTLFPFLLLLGWRRGHCDFSLRRVFSAISDRTSFSIGTYLPPHSKYVEPAPFVRPPNPAFSPLPSPGTHSPLCPPLRHRHPGCFLFLVFPPCIQLLLSSLPSPLLPPC